MRIKEVIKMKCKICDRKTTWDESYGYTSFIVCPKCHESIRKQYNGDFSQTMRLIFMLGRVAAFNGGEKQNEKN